MKRVPSEADADSHDVTSGEGNPENAGRVGDAADATLPRAEILRGTDAFTSLFRRSSTIRGRHVNLRYRIAEPDGRQLVAFIAPKRIGSAVTRNRLKRRMRECYRTNKDLLFPALHMHVCPPTMPEPSTAAPQAGTETGTRPSRLPLPAIHVAFIAQSETATHRELERDMLTLMRQFVKKAGDRIRG